MLKEKVSEEASRLGSDVGSILLHPLSPVLRGFHDPPLGKEV